MIDFIILAKTDSDKIFSMTSDLIQSLQDTEYPAGTSFSDYRITIVESNPESKYVYPESCDVVPFDFSKYGGFNYNYALNLGIRHAAERGGMDWICVMNNDIVCKSDWIVEISRQYEKHPEVQSICANTRNWQPGVIFGYTLHAHVDGCCIMYRHELNEIMELWDERFSFMYQDDDYCM